MRKQKRIDVRSNDQGEVKGGVGKFNKPNKNQHSENHNRRKSDHQKKCHGGVCGFGGEGKRRSLGNDR